MTKIPNIGKPATNALNSIGVTTLEQVSNLEKTTLRKMHGVGPKAISILEQSLTDHNLFFQDHSSSNVRPKTDFAVICSLNCDNAPKRRLIRDYLLAAASGNQPLLESVLSDSLRWIIPGKSPLEGKEAFIAAVVKEQTELSTLEIQSILTHGKEGSAHGILTTKTGEKIYFSDIIRFKSNQKDAPISEITSFVIQ
ncbi:DNA-binding protein [Enterococcus silesiacus]|uniref:DNA-binding protein n=1 Tax=Enterococcus silesiacus TaxID=332949 RepID=A0A0S3KEP1_9ENTE|nr:DNA-binding protein [Enterococcus silesiacus]ALS02752.1 DNA-binding protein [Enterococcus silesiacus]OJG85492.1 hypothetical protein RV15_GL002557 [Enterococcus silesiacus]